jgi:dTDP-4-dehydrorhamnose 3,5-epimerase
MMIDGVKTKKLTAHHDERGWLAEILRSDEEIFDEFGQVYVSVAYPGVVKGWHYHKLQTDHFCVLKGMLKVVLYDQREESKTFGEVNEFFMGEGNLMLVKIPPLVVHGVKAISSEPGFLINCPTRPYNHEQPDEYRIDPHSGQIPYSWERRDG